MRTHTFRRVSAILLTSVIATLGLASRQAHSQATPPPIPVDPSAPVPKPDAPPVNAPRGNQGSKPPKQPTPDQKPQEPAPPAWTNDPFYKRWFLVKELNANRQVAIPMVRGPKGLRNATLIENDAHQLRLFVVREALGTGGARRTVSVELHQGVIRDQAATRVVARLDVPVAQFWSFDGLEELAAIDCTPEQERFFIQNKAVWYSLGRWSPEGAKAAEGRAVQTVWRPLPDGDRTGFHLEETTGTRVWRDERSGFMRFDVSPHADDAAAGAPFFVKEDGSLVGIGGASVRNAGGNPPRDTPNAIAHDWWQAPPQPDRTGAMPKTGTCNKAAVGCRDLHTRLLAGEASIPMVSGPYGRSNGTILRGEDGTLRLVTVVEALGPGSGRESVDVELYTGTDGAAATKLVASLPKVPVARFRWLAELPEHCVLDFTPEEEASFLQPNRAATFALGDWHRGGARDVVGDAVQSEWRPNAPPTEAAPVQFEQTTARAVRTEPSTQVTRIDVEAPLHAPAAAAPVFAKSDGLLVGIGGEQRPFAANGPAVLAVPTVISFDDVLRIAGDGRGFDPWQVLDRQVGNWKNPDGYQRLAAELRSKGFDGLVGWRIANMVDGKLVDQYGAVPTTNPSERALAVLSEDPTDNLDLAVTLDANPPFEGRDDGSWSDAVVRIPDPKLANGAVRTIVAKQAPGAARSNARVLVIEAAPTASGARPLPSTSPMPSAR